MATEAQLTEAKAAYHDLSLGRAVVRVTRDGRSVEYNQADKNALKAYITELETALGKSARRRAPGRFLL